jgi:hypothetical protein
MVTKHFFKVLLTFMILISLGMAGILYVSSAADKQAQNTNSGTEACSGEAC